MSSAGGRADEQPRGQPDAQAPGRPGRDRPQGARRPRPADPADPGSYPPSAGDWSQLWRWELGQPNATPLLHRGTGVFSSLRMSRVITSLYMPEGSRWLFRLDQIISAAGRTADRHQHPGPGIRCLLEGTFNVQQDAESHRDLVPGDAWWETGSDTVIAWSSPQMAARFLRGMVLPVEWEGRVTGTWLSGITPPRGNWKLYLDRIIVV